MPSSWLRSDSPSVESIVIEAEDERRELPPIVVSDPRTRILAGLLALLDPRDRELLELTTDGATIAAVARAQGVAREQLSRRRDLLVEWLAYCAPITMSIEPTLAGITLSTKAALWWRWHAGSPVAALERAHPGLVVVRSRWRAPRRVG